MNRKLKEKIYFVLTFVFIFLVPNILIHYYDSKDSELFYQRLSEDNETCWRRAKEDSRETIWCNEIKKAVTLAYSESRNSNNFLLLLMFQPLIFVLLVSFYNLRKQVDELKEK